MEILLWLVPAALTTGAAMLYAAWAGRSRVDREPTEAERERFAAAIMKPLPGSAGEGPQRRAS